MNITRLKSFYKGKGHDVQGFTMYIAKKQEVVQLLELICDNNTSSIYTMRSFLDQTMLGVVPALF